MWVCAQPSPTGSRPHSYVVSASPRARSGRSSRFADSATTTNATPTTSSSPTVPQPSTLRILEPGPRPAGEPRAAGTGWPPHRRRLRLVHQRHLLVVGEREDHRPASVRGLVGGTRAGQRTRLRPQRSWLNVHLAHSSTNRFVVRWKCCCSRPPAAPCWFASSKKLTTAACPYRCRRYQNARKARS